MHEIIVKSVYSFILLEIAARKRQELECVNTEPLDSPVGSLLLLTRDINQHPHEQQSPPEVHRPHD